jgi:hypothetical protein
MLDWSVRGCVRTSGGYGTAWASGGSAITVEAPVKRSGCETVLSSVRIGSGCGECELFIGMNLSIINVFFFSL